jgi:hypothetical protein
MFSPLQRIKESREFVCDIVSLQSSSFSSNITSAMDAFRTGSGRYHLESQEHFEDYLKAIGNYYQLDGIN